jgi:hypothetical protein
MPELRIPSARYSRILACVYGVRRFRTATRYRRAHCCNEIANRAHPRLRIKLENQRQLTNVQDGMNLDDMAEMVVFEF